ncbi:hypothetical protein PAXRUDRAFT_624926 [Paxillus rubicundulus Ve08.2h10]|uniref:Uncharacterized protein n=1 Tax=Paxillus rubicundulus Ve08.2h10 TaxID=930991 RepID=A0A0D0DK82_9AGAM|nr:hypothetical protein PAXRUDRAFT_624926 [Paxillus rubicundulus Ve08.2h10]
MIDDTTLCLRRCSNTETRPSWAHIGTANPLGYPAIFVLQARETSTQSPNPLHLVRLRRASSLISRGSVACEPAERLVPGLLHSGRMNESVMSSHRLLSARRQFASAQPRYYMAIDQRLLATTRD